MVQPRRKDSSLFAAAMRERSLLQDADVRTLTTGIKLVEASQGLIFVLDVAVPRFGTMTPRTLYIQNQSLSSASMARLQIDA